MQHRALTEPRAVVRWVLTPQYVHVPLELLANRGWLIHSTKKARRKTKEYEKHSYKKFDRAY